MEEQRLWAEDEERWDQILRREYGVGMEGPEKTSEGGTWMKVVDVAHRGYVWRFGEHGKKNMEMGRRLWDVRMREMELAGREKEERRRARWAEREKEKEEGREGRSGEDDTTATVES